MCWNLFSSFLPGLQQASLNFLTRRSDYGEGWLYWVATKIHGSDKCLDASTWPLEVSVIVHQVVAFLGLAVGCYDDALF